MQPSPRLSRNPLDLAFWGLIVAICVVMGGGIYAMGVRNRVSRTMVSAGRESERPAPLAIPEGPVQFEGNIDPDPTSGPRQLTEPRINRISQPSRELAGIEQRLEEIASNLGELRQTVNRPVPVSGNTLEPTVEFVREFRHLLETGQRTLTQPMYDSERRLKNPVLNRTATPSAVLPTEELDTPRAHLGEEEPGSVTAMANPDNLRASSGHFDGVNPTQDEDTLDDSNSENSESPLTGNVTTEDTLDSEAASQQEPGETVTEEDSRKAPLSEPSDPDVVEPNPSRVPESTDVTSDSDPVPGPVEESDSTAGPTVEDVPDQDLSALEAADPAPGLKSPPTPPSPLPQATDNNSVDKSEEGSDTANQKIRSSDSPPAQTMVQVFYPQNREAEQLVRDIQKLLTPGVGKASATNRLAAKKTGGIGPAEKSPRQAIAVKDTPEALQRISDYLETIDKPARNDNNIAPKADITVDVTAVGVRLPNGGHQGVDLQELSAAEGPYTLWAHPSDRIQKCAAGLPNDRHGRLKIAILTGEESPLLRELRSQGSLQAVARSRVTMRTTEASRLVVEQETGDGRRDPRRDHSIGVRPVLDSNGSIRLQILPGTDDQGRPVENSTMPVATLGEVELRNGETAVIAGIVQSLPVTRSRTTTNRHASRTEGDLVEWVYLVTPRTTPVSARARYSPARRNESPIVQRLREQRQTAAR